MSLRRLLGLSAAVSGHYIRRSISTAASRPPWALFEKVTPTTRSALGASVRIVEPPRVSSLVVPALNVNVSSRDLTVKASAAPDPGSGVSQILIGHVSSTSGDGLLLITIYDTRARASRNRMGRLSVDFDAGHCPATHTTRFVCNPLTGQLSRLPDIGGPGQFLCPDIGFLTKADRGHGPPDRFAVAELYGNTMLRFLSETGKWDIVVTAPYQLPLARRMMMDQALALGGRLWWADLSWGVISADPFSDQPEPRFVELPRGSVLPARTVPDESVETESYRRVGVSEGKLRYAEVWQREPFVLSTFVLDDGEGGGWTMEHRLVLSRVWADGDHPWLPLPEKTTPKISAMDPLNSNVIYLTVGENVVAVGMGREEVIESCLLHKSTGWHIPCVLPPWLGSSKIPSAGVCVQEA